MLCDTAAERIERMLREMRAVPHYVTQHRTPRQLLLVGKNISLTFLKYFSCCLEHREEFCAVHNAKESRLLSIATFNELSSNVIEEFLAESERNVEEFKMKFLLTYASYKFADVFEIL